MKSKFILITIVILVLSISDIFSQTNTDKLTPSPLPQLQSFYLRLFESTIEALRIRSVSRTTFYSTEFTTGSAVDSITFSFTPSHVIFTADSTRTDTLFVSTVRTFTTTTTRKIFHSEIFDFPVAVTKWFLKVGKNVISSKKIRIFAY